MSRKEEVEQGSLLLPRGPAMEGIVESPEAVELANKLIKSTLSKKNLNNNKVNLKISEKKKNRNINRNIVKNSHSKNSISRRNKKNKKTTDSASSGASGAGASGSGASGSGASGSGASGSGASGSGASGSGASGSGASGASGGDKVIDVLENIRDDGSYPEGNPPPRKELWKPKIAGYSKVKKYNIDSKREHVDFDRKKSYGKNYNPSLRNNDDYKTKPDFSRLAGLSKSQRDIFTQKIGPNGPNLLTVLKWHEERFSKFEEFKEEVRSSLENIQKSISKLTKKSTYVNLSFHGKYNTAANTIIKYWRLYLFRRSISAIKIQRYYRYWVNVKQMNSQIMTVMNKLNKMKKQMRICGGFLNTFDPKKPLPLDKLKDIHSRIKTGVEQLIH